MLSDPTKPKSKARRWLFTQLSEAAQREESRGFREAIISLEAQETDATELERAHLRFLDPYSRGVNLAIMWYREVRHRVKTGEKGCP